MSSEFDISKAENYKISELKDYCKKNNIYFKSTARKGEIIESIKSWEENGRQCDAKPRTRGRPVGSSSKTKPKRSRSRELSGSDDEDNSKSERNGSDRKESERKEETKEKKKPGRKKKSETESKDKSDKKDLDKKSDKKDLDKKSDKKDLDKKSDKKDLDKKSDKKDSQHEGSERQHEPSDEKKSKIKEPDSIRKIIKNSDSTSNRALSPERIDSRRIRGRQDNTYKGDSVDSLVSELNDLKIETEFDKLSKLLLQSNSEFKYKFSNDYSTYKKEIKESTKDYSLESILHLFSLSSYIMETCSNEIDFHVMNSFYPRMKLNPEVILSKALYKMKQGNLNDIYFDLCNSLGYKTLNTKYVRDCLEFKQKMDSEFNIHIEHKNQTVESKIVFAGCRDEVNKDERRITYFEHYMQTKMKEFCECNELIPRDISFETIYQHFEQITSNNRKHSDFNTEICLVFELGKLEEIESTFLYVKDVMECGILNYEKTMEKINSLNLTIKSDNVSNSGMFMFVRVIRPYSAFSDGRIIPNRFKLGKYVINFDNSIIM
jgi:hypothetical protein